MLYAVPVIGKFPRDQKFVLGDRIETKLLDLQEDLIGAYYGRDGRRERLRRANVRVETIRSLVRLAYNLRLFSAKRYEVFSSKLDEVGRMIGGWEKSVKQVRPEQGTVGKRAS